MTDPRMTPTNDAPVTVEPAAELAEMLLVGTETGAFDHTPEEIGLHVMENAQAILNALASAPAGCSLCGTGPHDPDCPHHPVYDTLTEPASAPAGDGFGAIVLIDGKRPDWVRDDDWLLMRRKATGQWRWRSWYGFNWNDFDAIRARPDHPYYAVAPAGDGVEFAARVLWADGQMRLGQSISDLPRTRTDFRDRARKLLAEHPALARPRAAVGEQIEERATEIVEECLMRHGIDRSACEGTRTDARAILALQSPPAKVEG